MNKFQIWTKFKFEQILNMNEIQLWTNFEFLEI
jgi:hypothetical protein